ncbi:hypothetical protein BOO71_0005239 [Deinococcus marmoris]|uniref:Uncharacterized protein n=1 Tax=Deinococcus marmoris TaxID=249408 RepID=A0A1U7P0E0_9DEIO|nr:hypothetical protein BOO71_0005239 [Deinococcus marmoris]
MPSNGPGFHSGPATPRTPASALDQHAFPPGPRFWPAPPHAAQVRALGFRPRADVLIGLPPQGSSRSIGCGMCHQNLNPRFRNTPNSRSSRHSCELDKTSPVARWSLLKSSSPEGF